jgi:hypothetical protein
MRITISDNRQKLDFPIDVGVDYRIDSLGKDPDIHSPLLRLHHQALWSKPLDSRGFLNLEKNPKGYLMALPDQPVLSLSSDTITNSYRNTERLQHLIVNVPAHELDEFQYLGSTIGGKILFPGKRIDGNLTINVARGWNRKIEDRFDLTLECIRLQFDKKPNPLSKTFEVYWKFFELFRAFDEYVEFFLLQDLICDKGIRFFLPFDDFSRPAFPMDLHEYVDYMNSTKQFVISRNERIKTYLLGS